MFKESDPEGAPNHRSSHLTGEEERAIFFMLICVAEIMQIGSMYE
jgi:hypothetical protein